MSIGQNQHHKLPMKLLQVTNEVVSPKQTIILLIEDFESHQLSVLRTFDSQPSLHVHCKSVSEVLIQKVNTIKAINENKCVCVITPDKSVPTCSMIDATGMEHSLPWILFYFQTLMYVTNHLLVEIH